MKFSKYFFIYIIISILFVIYSYGFVDLNLHLSQSSLYESIHRPLQYFVFEKRGWAGGVYIGFVLSYWILYYFLLKNFDKKTITFDQCKKLIATISAIFLFSFPAFSYDIFNYMLTAKVTYTHKENPWIVRPIEIPNEPALAYTRAANKVALYGPTWILLTLIPHVMGMGNVWLTIITFKLLIIVFYLSFLTLIWKQTKSLWNVGFFAFNPLIIFELLNDSHNDIVMMTMVAAAIILLQRKSQLQRWVGIKLFAASVFIKGASIVLLPLYFFRARSSDFLWRMAYWLLFVVFCVSPLREEMYPWYFVWCLGCVVFLPKKHTFLYGFSIALSFGLLLRNTPYIITRQYAGYNQLARTLVTWIPVVSYFFWSCKKRFISS